MEKINFRNNNTPALNATNLNKLQDNIEEAINKIENTYSDSQTDTYSCDYVNKKHTYSTKEQVIGTWIDGKPLYRKVIKFNTTITAKNTLSVDTEIDNADTLFIENAFMYNNSGTVAENNRINYPIPFNIAPSETIYLSCRLNGNKIELYSDGGWNNLWEKIVILNYTKTID